MVELGLFCNFSLRTDIWTGKAYRKEWADIEPIASSPGTFRVGRQHRRSRYPEHPSTTLATSG